MKYFILLILVSGQLFAAGIERKIEHAKKTGIYELGIGSELMLESNDSRIQGSAVFLGSAVHPDGSGTYEIYLNKRSQKVYYIDSKNFSSDRRFQKVLNPYEQAGETCTGYAIYGFLQQSFLSGFQGNGMLGKRLATETGRTNLLVDNVSEYYLTPKHRYSIEGILNKYGRDFGFACTRYKYKTFEGAKSRVLGQLEQGMPVMISFNIGPDMYNSPLKIAQLGNPVAMDDRVWIPRKVGEKNSGGHSIVAAAAFEFENKTYLITIDSDWAEPRLWDLESFLNDRTALEEVEFTTCR